jgi:hypothetical protein
MEAMLYGARECSVHRVHRPATSVYREASFRHGTLQVANATDPLWMCPWHRKDDDEPVVSDQIRITGLTSNPVCSKK